MTQIPNPDEAQDQTEAKQAIDVPTGRLAYLVLETKRDEKGWIVCICEENKPGYYKTNWRWDCSFEEARNLINERNWRLGLTPNEASKIVLSSMFAQMVSEANAET